MPRSSLYRMLRGYTREIYHQARHRFGLCRIVARNPILVYQMGKVGSSTVVRSLEASGFGPVLHVHTLTPEVLARARARQRRSPSPYLHEHLIVSSVLLRKIRQGMFPCHIITLTREPVARAISHVFEDNQKKLEWWWRQQGSFSAEEVMAVVTELLRSDNGIADPTQWFQQELQTVTGVNIFERPYDFERGYTCFEAEPAPVLLMRLEDLNRSLQPALSAFLNVDEDRITVSGANVGAQKWYADILREVKATYQVPDDVAERVFNTPYFQHFYAGDTADIRSHWTGATGYE